MLQSSFWKTVGFEAKFTKTLTKYGEEEPSGYLANLGNVPPRKNSSDGAVDDELSWFYADLHFLKQLKEQLSSTRRGQGTGVSSSLPTNRCELCGQLILETFLY